MSDLFGNHIVGFPTRWLKFNFTVDIVIFTIKKCIPSFASEFINQKVKLGNDEEILSLNQSDMMVQY